MSSGRATGNEDPGDEEILATAYAEGRILITLDKDFGELAVVWRSPDSPRKGRARGRINPLIRDSILR